MRLFLAFSFAAILTIALPARSDACDCQYFTPQEHLAAADYAFRGTVTWIGIDQDGFGLRVEFDVVNVWKGEPTPTIAVYTGMYSLDCSGFPFDVGVEYVVFAWYWESDPSKLDVGFCDGAFEVDNNEDAIALLDADTRDTQGIAYPAGGSGGLAKPSLPKTVRYFGMIAAFVVVAILFKVRNHLGNSGPGRALRCLTLSKIGSPAQQLDLDLAHLEQGIHDWLRRRLDQLR